MGQDEWMRTFERLEQLADETFADVNERNKLLRQNVSTSKQNASIRRKMQQLSTEINQLVNDLDRLASKRKLNGKEVGRRQDLLEGLLNRRDRLQAMCKEEESIERETLFDGIVNTGKTWGTQETVDTVNRTNQDVSYLQRQKMKDQDAQMDGLIGSVAKQNEVAVEISNELDVHSALLDDMQDGVAGTTENVRKTNVRLMKFEEKVKVGGCWGCILVQAIVLVLIILLL